MSEDGTSAHILKEVEISFYEWWDEHSRRVGDDYIVPIVLAKAFLMLILLSEDPSTATQKCVKIFEDTNKKIMGGND